MTDPNRFVVTEGATGSFVATDTVTLEGVTQHFQYVKLAWGPDDTVNLVDSATGKHIPVQLYAGGSAVTTTGNALDVNLSTSGITLNTSLANLGITSVFVEGTTYATVPVMISGTTAIGGAVNVSGTIVGGTLDSITLVGGTIDTISSATITGGTLDSVTISGGTIDAITEVSSATISGGTIDTITSATIVGGTLDSVSIAHGVTVNATDLDIRGLSLGAIGFSGNTLSTTTDSVVVQGVSGAFPVTTLLSGASAQGVASSPIGSSGDALKVAVVDAAINATVNVGTEVAVTSTGTHLQVSGNSAGHSNTHPVGIAGALGATAIGVAIHGACGGGTIDVSNSSVKISSGTVTATVSATDLDIRSLSGGTSGYTGPFDTDTDSVVVQGISGAYPIGNVLYGISTGIDSPTPVALDVDFIDNTPTLKTAIDGRGITNTTALQIQGRVDGLTLNPVPIIGVCAGDLVGVTFPSLDTQTVVGGASQDTIKTFLHGLSSGTTVMPVGVSGDALKVFMENINVTANITDTSIDVSNTDIAVTGASAGTNPVFVSGTAGSTHAYPIMVQGFHASGSSADAKIWPVGISFDNKHELDGLSGGMIDVITKLSGISAGIDGVTVGLFDHIDTIHQQEAFENLETAVGVKAESEATIVTALDRLHGAYVTDDTIPAAKTIPVSVAAPTGLITARKTAPTGTAQPISTLTNTLNSGVRVKLPSSAGTANVFVGGSGVSSTNGYLLEPGDDVFIEIEAMNLVFVVAETTAVDVYAIGS